jgi:hypothetical protein
VTPVNQQSILYTSQFPLYSIPFACGHAVQDFDCDKLVGLAETEADNLIVAAGKYSQVAKRDGADQMLPAILDMNRVCLTIDAGRVTEAHLG